jgi:protein involved in polysaccharide export with SLBB domain
MRALVAALAVTLALAAIATTAEAVPVVVGSPLIGHYKKTPIYASVTATNTTFEEAGALATSPVSGAVIRWNILEPEGGPFALRVLRPSADNHWVASATSTPQTFANAGGKQTIATDLPIQAGDRVGIDIPEEGELGIISLTKPGAYGWIPTLAEGQSTSEEEGELKFEFGFNAEVQPTPTVTAVSPASGFFKGGSSVTISGTDFASVSAVSFGAVPASSFAVDSEGQIVVPAPPGVLGTAANVTVTTVAGASASGAASLFTYTACVVPKLKKSKLKTAKKRLAKAGCKIGKVAKKKGGTAKKGKVVKQGAKPGKKLAPGSKVGVTLG